MANSRWFGAKRRTTGTGGRTRLHAGGVPDVQRPSGRVDRSTFMSGGIALRAQPPAMATTPPAFDAVRRSRRRFLPRHGRAVAREAALRSLARSCREAASGVWPFAAKRQ